MLVGNVSFQLQTGEILGLIGQSGSGKTLIASALCGLLPPLLGLSGGKVVFQGKDLSAGGEKEWRNHRGRDIFYLFQSPLAALNPTLKIRCQIEETLRKHFKLDRKTAKVHSLSLLEQVGIIGKKSESYPFELSGGMRQRAMIAMALGLKPRLLIADEPFTGLDGLHEIEVLNLLKKMHNDGTALLIISHDLRMVAGWVDRVAVLVEGMIAEEVAAKDLFSRSRHPYTKALIDNMIYLEKALEPAA